jgi:DNA-binding CsgD family transcriptional regulator
VTATGERVWQSLSAREREVLLRVCADGADLLTISEEMGVARNTIATHLNRIYEKAGTENRMSMTMFAVRHGMAPCPFCGSDNAA